MGSVIGMTDEEGTVVASYSYDPWGRVTNETAIGDEIAYRNPLRYRAYYQDAETGLYYMPARFYDPTTYRFLSADPAPPSPGDPGSLNRYLYCQDDPIQNIDPDGRELMGYMVSLYTKIWGDRDRAYAFAGSHKVGKWDYSPWRYARLSQRLKSGGGTKATGPRIGFPMAMDTARDRLVKSGQDWADFGVETVTLSDGTPYGRKNWDIRVSPPTEVEWGLASGYRA